MTMEIRPIYSALMRNKAGLALIVLQVAITLAVVCNSLFIILDRAERVGKPSGMDEANTFMIRSLGFTSNFDLRNTMREDIDAIESLPGGQWRHRDSGEPLREERDRTPLQHVKLQRDAVRAQLEAAVPQLLGMPADTHPFDRTVGALIIGLGPTMVNLLFNAGQGG